MVILGFAKKETSDFVPAEHSIRETKHSLCIVHRTFDSMSQTFDPMTYSTVNMITPCFRKYKECLIKKPNVR